MLCCDYITLNIHTMRFGGALRGLGQSRDFGNEPVIPVPNLRILPLLGNNRKGSFVHIYLFLVAFSTFSSKFIFIQLRSIIIYLSDSQNTTMSDMEYFIGFDV